VLLSDLDEVSRQVASTRSRLAKIELLAGALRRLGPGEVRAGASYLAGELPQGRIGVGGAALRGAMRGAEPAATATLALADVDAALSRLAVLDGPGSAARRRTELGALLARATAGEQDFLARLLFGELRQGAVEGLLVEAVARAASVPVAEVRRALMASGDLRAVAEAALAEGAAGLSRLRVRVLEPIQPMLAQSADDVGEALGALGEAALDWKLDGARVQVHKDGGEVRAFSRSLRDVTVAVPEVVEAVRAMAPRRLVLDGEALALRSDGRPEPFQVTMRRFGRKLHDEALRAALPLSVHFFDLLLLDDDELLARPGRERLAALDATVPSALRVPRLVTADAAAAQAFFDDALSRGHEGLVAKSLAAPYEAGQRGAGWLKLKRARTLDLVVLAAEWGHGRRAGWLSNLHLGARDPAAGGFAMLGKTFKGMTDAMLAWQTEALQRLQLGTDGLTVHVRPELVVEVAFSDVQASPRYPAGLALRFARVKRYRPDKRAEEADTIDTVREIYAAQARREEGSG
jgi:DNA ligase-1